MSKFVDEKGRIFGKVSLIDIFVLFFALVMVFAVYLRFFSNETTSLRGGNDTFTYVACVRGVRQWTVDGFHVGDKLWEDDHETCLGTIAGIEAVPTKWEYDLMTGEIVTASAENRYDVYLTIEAEGLVSNNRYYAARTFEIGANGTIYFYTKYCSVSATVWSIG